VGCWDLDTNCIYNIDNFNSVQRAKVLTYIGKPTPSYSLTQGIWREWEFSGKECEILQKQVQKNGEVKLRVEGPKTLPIGRSSQMMQWGFRIWTSSGGGLSFVLIWKSHTLSIQRTYS